ncbi:MAG: RNA 2',3'-cyclic phosphodiesterase [Acidobacteriia bacterium]|nr:RNA 2',3'-cyclic phosphodiesterase [Terriglobia bacterium]
MRLFVAFDIPEEVRAAMAVVAAKLQNVCASARWVRLEGAHVTLKFIGEAPAGKVDGIKTALAGMPFPSAFKILYRGVGFFPHERRPQVLWAGIEAGPELRALAEAVESSLEPLGIARERREFSPHVTLARFKSPGDLAELRSAIAAAGALEFGQSTPTEFHLYQSVLKPGGAEYTRLATFGSKGSAAS